jgi:cytoskeletal protein RodZ
VKPLAAQAIRSAGEAAPSQQTAQPQTPPAQAPAPALAGVVSTSHVLAAGPQVAPAAPPVAAPQPVASAQPAITKEPEQKKGVETRGLHNVVTSGKGDMIISVPGQSQPVQYDYSQTNTAGTGAPPVR